MERRLGPRADPPPPAVRRLSHKLVNGSAFALFAGWSGLAVVGTVDAAAIDRAFIWLTYPPAPTARMAVEVRVPPLVRVAAD